MLKAMGNMVIIKPEEKDLKRESGLADVEEKNDIPMCGYIQSEQAFYESPDTGRVPIFGCKVWYKKWSSHEIIVKGVNHVLVDFKDLLAVELPDKNTTVINPKLN